MRNRDGGFSLLEILLGISIFMVGMIGITALQISALKSNTFAGNLSEATALAASKIEELLAMDYDDVVDTDADGTDQDADNDGVDDDGGGFGLDDDTDATADGTDTGVGSDGSYTVFWNVAVDEPLPRCKKIKVIIRWTVKGVPRQITMSTTMVEELG